MAADEIHRCKKSRESDICNKFPLVKAKMSREDCKQFIQNHGLPVPQKSGCWICPFQRNEQWRKLKRLHPDLYEKAKTLERVNMAKRAEQGKLPLTLSANGKRLEVITMEGQMEMWGATFVTLLG
jgi:3'-phosphoadenosine 5'-phosphosulfate sulfotransferase (PAPS reductase)/FAD synthetase